MYPGNSLFIYNIPPEHPKLPPAQSGESPELSGCSRETIYRYCAEAIQPPDKGALGKVRGGEESRHCGEESRYCVEELQYYVEELRHCVEESRYCVEELRYYVEELRHCVEESRYCVEELRAASLLAAALGASPKEALLLGGPVPHDGDGNGSQGGQVVGHRPGHLHL
jgi:hypothetical protein